MAEKAVAKDGKRSVTVHLDLDVFEAIKKMADEDERPVTTYLERHLRKAFKAQPQASGAVFDEQKIAETRMTGGFPHGGGMDEGTSEERLTRTARELGKSQL